jgi:nucleoside-diphosphate-sugar epimerase
MPAAPVNPPLPKELTAAARVLVLGGGYTGRRFALALQRQGVTVTLTHRRVPQEPPGAEEPLSCLRFDASGGHIPTRAELAGTTHVLVTIPPDEAGQDPVLKRLAMVLAELPLQWLGYLSTTGVYGDQGGGWVDETTPTAPGLERSVARLGCERAWRRSDLPVQIFRLPAIYGPGRTPFESLRTGTARLIHKPGQVFSRIHVDDLVGAMLHCIALPVGQRPQTLILADEAPSPSSETLGYAAHLLDCKLPDVQEYAEIAPGLSPMARSFWSENRRASSLLLRETLGYQMRYPTYREGYRACWSGGTGGLSLASRSERNGSGPERSGRLRS